MLLVPFALIPRGTLPRTFVLPSALGFSLLSLERCPSFRMRIHPSSTASRQNCSGSTGRWNYSDVATLPFSAPDGQSLPEVVVNVAIAMASRCHGST